MVVSMAGPGKLMRAVQYDGYGGGAAGLKVHIDDLYIILLLVLDSVLCCWKWVRVEISVLLVVCFTLVYLYDDLDWNEVTKLDFSVL